MALTLTTADAVLKEDYLPGVREQLNNDTALAFFEKNSEDVVGRRAVLALHLQRNAGVGSRLEGGTLPTAGNQGYYDEYVSLKYHYAHVQVTGPTIKAMASDKGSFVRAIRSEMDGATNDLRRNLNRQCFGTSNGVVAKCGTTTSSTTIQLDTSATIQQMRQLEVGLIVDIGTVANPVAIASAVTITANSNTAGGTITVSGSAVSTTTADFVFISGAGGAAGGVGQKELTGLQTIVDSANALFNVDPATYPIWASYKDSNSGTNRALTENMFAKAQQSIHISGGTDVDVWMCSDGVHRAYAALLTSLKRFADTVDLKGGYKGLSAAAGGATVVPVTWDRDCPGNHAFALRSANLIEFRMSDWEWMDQDGAVLQRVIGQDAYEAVLYKYAELATDKRNAHGLVTDITEA